MKSDKEWILWGKHDPLFAVSSWKGKEKGGAQPWGEGEFYHLGYSDWADFFARWESYGVNKTHGLEIGCGAGRITSQLVKTFQKVSATDVSEDQIRIAQKAVMPSPVSFLLTDGTKIALPDSSVSAVFSCHVFQHFDSLHNALDVFKELYRVLCADGSICIHLPLFQLPDFPLRHLIRAEINCWKKVGDVRATLQRLCNNRIMRGLPYELEVIRHQLTGLGYENIETRGFAMKSNSSWHTVLLAKKPAAKS